MSAQTFKAPSFLSPAVHLPNFPGVIERGANADLDLLIGPDGTAATTLEANDLIKWFKLQGGSKILYGRIDCEDLDGHATPTLTLDLLVSDGTTTKYIFDEATIGQSGGFADSRDAAAVGVLDAFDANSAIGYVIPWDETDWYVGLKVGTAAATAQNDAVRVTIGYTMALENADSQRTIPTGNP